MSPKWLSNRSSQPVAPNATLELNAEKSQFSLGDHVKGGVKIVSQDEFDVDQAVVCLSCNENIRRNSVYANQFGVQQSEYWENAIALRHHIQKIRTRPYPAGILLHLPL
ncbi:MAG: hypothetical protein ABSE15_03770 [Candidatus Bathyarchaeia archaeon]|jgi:hypothetical protein